LFSTWETQTDWLTSPLRGCAGPARGGRRLLVDETEKERSVRQGVSTQLKASPPVSRMTCGRASRRPGTLSVGGHSIGSYPMETNRSRLYEIEEAGVKL